MGIPKKPISRIEQYLAGICTALGVYPEGGDEDVKVLFFEEGATGMAVREGDNYATYAEFIESLDSDADKVIPVYINNRPVLEVDEARDGYDFLIADGILSDDPDTLFYLAKYTIADAPDAETGLYTFTTASYSITLTVVE